MLLAIILIPAVFAAFAWGATSNKLRPWLITLGGAAHLAATISVLGAGRQEMFGRWLALDPLSRLFLLHVSVIFFICSLYAPNYLALRQDRPNRVFCSCVLLGLSAMSLVILSHHLGLMWVAMEATTLVSAPSLYFNHNPRSLEATWKYLLIVSVGIAVALLGSFFLAYAEVQAGTEPTLLLDDLVQKSSRYSEPWLHAAFALLLVGYGAKMGLAPMHTWKPDAYGEAPGVIGALLAGSLTSCAFLAVIRAYHVARADASASKTLVFIGLLSMATSALYMLKQRDIKRLLAYSSVEHMGMLALGLGLGGAGIAAALLHVIHNGICKTGMFLAAGNIHRAYGSKTTDEVRGVLRTLPFSGAMLLVGFFAITGSPPFAPFVSEYQLITAAFATHSTALGLAIVACLLLVFLGMGNTLIGCAFGPDPDAEDRRRFQDTFRMCAPVALCMGLTLLLGVYNPPFLTKLLREAVEFLS